MKEKATSTQIQCNFTYERPELSYVYGCYCDCTVFWISVDSGLLLRSKKERFILKSLLFRCIQFSSPCSSAFCSFWNKLRGSSVLPCSLCDLIKEFGAVRCPGGGLQPWLYIRISLDIFENSWCRSFTSRNFYYLQIMSRKTGISY